LLNAGRRSEGRGDGRGDPDNNPDKVRQLQIALYRKAKAEPKYRFWSLYGELLRKDVLETALAAQQRNGGAAGVDGQSMESITADPAQRQQWLDRLQEELQAKTYRASRCGG